LTFGHVEWNDRTSYGYDSLELSWHPEALRNGAGLAPDYGRCHHTGNYFIDNGDDRVKGIENSGVSLCRKEFVEYRTSPAKPNVSGLRFAVSLNDARLIETGVKFPTRTAPRLQGALRVGSVRANTEYCERYFWITAREAMTSKFPPFTVPPECAKSASVSIGNIESFRIGFSYGA
jgi:outer membrane scaffolding protein for murein synthesis (MipA/OmpV family)